MTDISNFAIVHRATNGNVVPYPPNTDEYTYVGSCIMIAQKLLSTPKARQELVQLALEFDHTQPATWYGKFNNDQARARQYVDFFLNKINTEFPFVIVDEQITNLRNLGFHPRGSWDGGLNDFDSRVQAVNLNGSRVHDMIRSSDGTNGPRFRTFQFLFANTFVHEVGAHLLITFLGQGRPITPPTIGAATPGYSINGAGESGRRLETMLFQGTIEYYRDPSQDAHQSGLPHVILVDGSAYRITQAAIDQTVLKSFTFPYALSAKSTPRTQRQYMDAAPIPAAAFTDPSNRPLLAKSLLRGHRVYVNINSTLDGVPFNPTLRPQLVQ